jgi:hypothetical protein
VADSDETFDPLPALTEPPDPSTELTMQDALADAQPDDATTPPPTPLGRAPAYDFAQHRMLPGGFGGPLMTRGRGTLQTWVEKCVRTRRGENPAVDPDFGCDITVEDLLEEGGPYDAATVAEYLAAVERALLAHPRITGIDDLDVQGGADDDAVFLSFTVATDGDDLGELTFDRLTLGD